MKKRPAQIGRGALVNNIPCGLRFQSGYDKFTAKEIAARKAEEEIIAGNLHLPYSFPQFVAIIAPGKVFVKPIFLIKFRFRINKVKRLRPKRFLNRKASERVHTLL